RSTRFPYTTLFRSHLQLDDGAGRVGLVFLGVEVSGTALDPADARQRALDRVRVCLVDRQIETYPVLPVTLETLDVARAERGGLCAGIQLGGEFQIEVR